MPNEEIMMLKDRIESQLSPLKVYLFGSYAYGNPTPDSDYDFYIVVDNSRYNTHEEAMNAYRAIRHARSKQVDILVGTDQRFEERKIDGMPTIENEVFRKGILLYDSANSSVPSMA